MTGIEWSGYVPGDREEIEMQLRRGEKTPEEAEAWAREKKEPPFIPKNPDPARFDPMKEPEWTLSMAAAWIVWRTPESVRKHWDAYLLECKEWRFSEWRFADGRREAGWEARRCNPVSLHDIFKEAARSDFNDSKLNAKTQIDSLWNQLREGRIEATGVPHFIAGRQGLPLIRADIASSAPKRLQIPRHEWIDLSPWDFHGGPADSVATANDVEPRYDRVRVWREQVLSNWAALQDARASNETDLTHTGFPGRPSSRRLIEAEFQRMIDSGELLKTVKATAQALSNWHANRHADLPRTQPGTIENIIRRKYAASAHGVKATK